MGMDRSPGRHLADPGQHRVQDLRLQVVEGRHVALHGSDMALRVLLEGHQAVILQLALLNGLVHRLADNAGDGVDTRVVAMLSSRGRIWVAAMNVRVSSRAVIRNARLTRTRRRLHCRRK